MAKKASSHSLSKSSRVLASTSLLLPFMLPMQSHALPSKHSAWMPSSLHQAVNASLSLTFSSTSLQPHKFHEDHILGTSFDMIAMAHHEHVADKAFQAVRHEIARLDKILSHYRPDSELSHLNNAHSLVVSEDLFNVVHASETWQKKTLNGFNGRLGVPLQHWKEAVAQNQLPDHTQLLEHINQARNATVELDKTTHTIVKPKGVTFALDAVAKGYIIDAALKAARTAAPELAGLMIDIGGDIICWGESPRCEGWQVGLTHPDALEDNASATHVVQLKNQAIATSGKGPRDLCIDGCQYAHILSPETGNSAEHIIRATVVAPTAADADALSTAFTALPPEQSLALANQLSNIEALLVTKEGHYLTSTGWHTLLGQLEDTPTVAPLLFAQATPTTLNDATTASTQPWPEEFKAIIEYEVPKLEADVYRAPYVAIWITNARKELVKTLLVLGNDSKYLSNNYVWWRRFGRKTAQLDTITKPTRQPGRYTIIWSGLDESAQKVQQGRYTLHIEAAREHGGHTYESIELDVGSKNIKKTLPSKDEMGNVTLRYEK